MSSQRDAMLGRDRRLCDVRRGVTYLRLIDELAHRQWRHYGAVPPIPAQIITDIDSTAKQSNNVLSDGQTLHVDTPKDFCSNQTSVSRIGLSTSRLPPFEAAIFNTTVNKYSMPAPSVKTSIKTKPVTESKNKRSSVLLRHSHGSRQTQWSHSSPVHQQIFLNSSAIKAADKQDLLQEVDSGARSFLQNLHISWESRDQEFQAPQPKSYTPKRYLPMSRAREAMAGSGNGDGRRQLKVLTDFRSCNGTVCVIRPPEQITDRMVSGLHTTQDDKFDIEALSREKTYALLMRIDRLLEPNRAYFTSDFTSSLEEIRSTQLSLISELDDDQAILHNDLHMSVCKTNHYNKSYDLHRRSRTQMKAKHFDQLTPVFKRLGEDSLDLHKKCQEWIAKSFRNSNYGV